MIKIISGIGAISHPFDVEGQASFAELQNTPFFGTTNANIVVDHVGTPVLGNANIPFIANKLLLSQPSGGPSAPSSIPTQVSPPPVISVSPKTVPQKFSMTSGQASYDTLFHEFDIDCYPVYNFWTADEETNDTQAVGDRDLDDVPRYIRVVWNVAPDLVPPQRRLTPSKRQRDFSPSAIGSKPGMRNSITFKGVVFTPDHLNNFALVKQNIANGYVAPGTVNAVVELPTRVSVPADPVISTDSYDHIDEDTFLQHPDFEGVSLEELRSNVNSLTNGILYSGKVAVEDVSAGSRSDQVNLFSGKFSVQKPPTNGGTMVIQGAASAGGPPLSFEVKTPEAMEQNPIDVDPLLELVEKVTAPPPAIPDDTANRVKARFVYPSLGGLLDPTKVRTMQSPEHAETVTALAQFLPNLEVMNAAGMQNRPQTIPVPTFPSPPNVPFLEYVGYILEKYERQDSGVFVLKETIDLPHREFGEYIDSKVKYSGIYRYRVKAVLRVTRPGPGVSGGGFVGPNGPGSQSPTPYQSAYFAGEWSKTWAYGMIIDVVPPAPPDELVVRPDSVRKRVVVSFKLPGNEQRDIYYMRLFRKIQDQNGNDISGWQQVGDDWGPENVLYIDTDVDFFQNNQRRYVYAAQTVTRHNEQSSLSDQIGVRLNRDFMTYGEYPVAFVSQAGVRVECHGSFGVHPYKRFYTEIVVPNDVPFSFSGREAHGTIALDGNQYYVVVESLDTGEKLTFPVKIVYNNQRTIVDRKSRGFVGTTPTTRKQVAPVDQNAPMPPPSFRNWMPATPLPRNARTILATSTQRNFNPGSLK